MEPPIKNNLEPCNAQIFSQLTRLHDAWLTCIWASCCIFNFIFKVLSIGLLKYSFQHADKITKVLCRFSSIKLCTLQAFLLGFQSSLILLKSVRKNVKPLWVGSSTCWLIRYAKSFHFIIAVKAQSESWIIKLIVWLICHFVKFVSCSETNRFKFVKFRVQKKAFLL